MTATWHVIQVWLGHHHMYALVLTSLPQLSVLVAFSVSVETLYRAWRTLALKTKVRSFVLLRAEHDEVLNHLYATAAFRKLNSEDLEIASREIEKIIKEKLPERDQKLVEAGMNQPSRIGRDRYISHLLTAA